MEQTTKTRKPSSIFSRCSWSGITRSDAAMLGFNYSATGNKESVECRGCGKRVNLRGAPGNSELLMIPTHNRKTS